MEIGLEQRKNRTLSDAFSNPHEDDHSHSALMIMNS